MIAIVTKMNCCSMMGSPLLVNKVAVNYAVLLKRNFYAATNLIMLIDCCFGVLASFFW